MDIIIDGLRKYYGRQNAVDELFFIVVSDNITDNNFSDSSG